MLYFKCKYYQACDNKDNYYCCKEKPKQIKRGVERMVEYLHTKGILIKRRWKPCHTL